MDQTDPSQTNSAPLAPSNNLPQQIPDPPAAPSPSEPQMSTFSETAGKTVSPKGSFRAIFLILLLLTMVSAGATTFILLNWSKPIDSTSQAQTPISTPTLEEIGDTEVEINPFSEGVPAVNPFDQTASDSTNIFNDFEESTDSGENPNPF